MASYVVKRWIKALSRIIAGQNAQLETAPAVTADAVTAVQVHKEAPLSSDPAKDMSVDSIITMSPWARLVAYARAPFVYISEALMCHLSRLTLADSAAARCRKQMQLERISTAEAAESAIMESQFNSFTAESKGTAYSAPTVDTTAVETVFTTEDTATANRAAVTDVEAREAVGTVVSAGMFAWFMPEQAGNRVKIYQAFSAIQSGNRVAIDTESESTYWANPYMEGNRLKLAFVESSTQTDNRLELR